MEYDIEVIEQISVSLARMFRYSIKVQEFVTVREEMECTINYLKIMSIRYEDKFDIKINISEELYEMKIMKMILQPIVENAIYHGLERKNSQGNLLISGSKKIMKFYILKYQMMEKVLMKMNW